MHSLQTNFVLLQVFMTTWLLAFFIVLMQAFIDFMHAYFRVVLYFLFFIIYLFYICVLLCFFCLMQAFFLDFMHALFGGFYYIFRCFCSWFFNFLFYIWVVVFFLPNLLHCFHAIHFPSAIRRIQDVVLIQDRWFRQRDCLFFIKKNAKC